MRKTKLTITMKMNESVVIGDDIVMTVKRKSGNSVAVSFFAPEDVVIHRKALLEETGVRPVAEFLANPRRPT